MSDIEPYHLFYIPWLVMLIMLCAYVFMEEDDSDEYTYLVIIVFGLGIFSMIVQLTIDKKWCSVGTFGCILLFTIISGIFVFL